jgi:hypothetical protein
MGDEESPEGVYQDLYQKISEGYTVEGEMLIAGGKEVEFEESEMGYDILLDSRPLGRTCDNYFLVYLTELYEGDVPNAMEKLDALAKNKRLIQATELQSQITRDETGFTIGTRSVDYSRRFFRCSCPDWKYRRHLGGCKHIMALRLLDA